MENKNEQEYVLESKDKSLIISASAGSGKTSTMIRKIFKTIYDNKVDISNLLVLTYTNSAAAEMKARLNEYLLSKCAESDDKLFLQNQINQLSIADISTFHSFYEKLIKSYYYLLDISPSFVIADENEMQLLKMQAFRQATINFKQDEQKYLNLFSAFNKKKSEHAIFEKIKKLQEFLTAETDEMFWLDNIALSMINDPKISTDILEDFCNEQILFAIKNLEVLLNASVSKEQDRIPAHINACLSDLNSLLSCDMKMKQSCLQNFAFSRFVATKNDDKEIIEKLKSIKSNFTKFVKENFKDANIQLFDKNDSELLEIKEKYKLFVDFYKLYKNELDTIKLVNSIYDFSDIEKMALKLLSLPQVENEVKNKYKFVFVDEFQDVNNIQNEILKHLVRQNNVFIVGDPKQSIYAFRQSDVSIFLNKSKEFRQSEYAEEFNLKNNYRSNNKILEFCNTIFKNIITEKTAGLNYKETSMFHPFADIPTKFAPVNILLSRQVKKEKEKTKLNLYKVFDAKTKQLTYNNEAYMIFKKICELLDGEIYDDKIKTFRKIKYSDITILVRSRGNLSNSLAKIFEDYNVPYVLNAEKDLKKSKLVLALICALNLISNYYDDIDLATFLNRFCGLSFQDLSEIRLKFPQLKFKDACKEYFNLFDAQGSIINGIKLLYTLLERAKKICDVEGVFKSLNWLIKNSKFLNFVDELDGNEEEQQMMQSFLTFIETNKYNNNLILLLNLINENDTLKVEQNLNGGLDRINITTIHASKGLEYNIVFLAELGKSIFKNSHSSDIKINKNLGIALRINEADDVSIFEKAIKIKERELELAESLRLLYVGMTRAKNHLFLTAQGKFEEINFVDENNINFVESNYMQYILGSLENKNVLSDFENEDFCLKYFDEENVESDVNKNELKINNSDILLQNIEKIREFDFKNQLSGYAQKTSVSKILSDENEQSCVTYLPNSLELDEHLQGVQMGTEIGIAYHEIMERANINIDKKDLKFICEDVYKKYLEKAVEFEENFVENSTNLTFNALQNIKKIVGQNVKIYKEKKFMINASPYEIFGEGVKQKVLIQGIIDFFAIGEKVILIDYKYSLIKDDIKLKQKYESQLKIYAFALSKFLNKNIDEIYILNLKNGHIINL